MTGRSVCVALGGMLAMLVTACGGGDGEPAALPETGVEICDELDRTERFRYVVDYVVESPQQDPAPTNVVLEGTGYAIGPQAATFRLAQKFTGSFVQPDRADYELSGPDQTTVRGIRIGQNQYYFLNDTWQIESEPPPFVFAPTTLCDAIVSPLDLTGATGGVENVGDTQAQHIRLEGVPLSVMSEVFGPGSDMGRLLTTYNVDLWLRQKDSRLLKVTVASTATYPYGRTLSTEVGLEVSSFNDNDIEVKPPL